MTTNINLAEFEPTDEMKARWPKVSDKTTVRTIKDVRMGHPLYDADVPLEKTGDYWCCYLGELDKLYVYVASDRPECAVPLSLSPESILGRVVIAKTRMGVVQDIGEVIGYFPAPVYKIRRPDGVEFTWQVAMCHVVDEGCPECRAGTDR